MISNNKPGAVHKTLAYFGAMIYCRWRAVYVYDLNDYICSYIDVHIYIYIYIYKYTHHLCVCVYIYIYIYMYWVGRKPLNTGESLGQLLESFLYTCV